MAKIQFSIEELGFSMNSSVPNLTATEAQYLFAGITDRLNDIIKTKDYSQEPTLSVVSEDNTVSVKESLKKESSVKESTSKSQDYRTESLWQVINSFVQESRQDPSHNQDVFMVDPSGCEHPCVLQNIKGYSNFRFQVFFPTESTLHTGTYSNYAVIREQDHLICKVYANGKITVQYRDLEQLENQRHTDVKVQTVEEPMR